MGVAIVAPSAAMPIRAMRKPKKRGEDSDSREARIKDVGEEQRVAIGALSSSDVGVAIGALSSSDVGDAIGAHTPPGP